MPTPFTPPTPSDLAREEQSYALEQSMAEARLEARDRMGRDVRGKYRAVGCKQEGV